MNLPGVQSEKPMETEVAGKRAWSRSLLPSPCDRGLPAPPDRTLIPPDTVGCFLSLGNGPQPSPTLVRAYSWSPWRFLPATWCTTTGTSPSCMGGGEEAWLWCRHRRATTHTHHGRLGADGPSATVHTVDFTSRVDFIRFPFYHPPPYWFYLIGERSTQKINLTYSGYL